MIVMGREEDGLPLESRIGAVQAPDDVPGADRAQPREDPRPRSQRQRYGTEIAASRGLPQGVEILAGRLEEITGEGVGDPGRQSQRRAATGAERDVELLAPPRVPDDAPTVASRRVGVDQDRAGGPGARSALVFVGPAAVVGQGLATEAGRVV